MVRRWTVVSVVLIAAFLGLMSICSLFVSGDMGQAQVQATTYTTITSITSTSTTVETQTITIVSIVAVIMVSLVTVISRFVWKAYRQTSTSPLPPAPSRMGEASSERLLYEGSISSDDEEFLKTFGREGDWGGLDWPRIPSPEEEEYLKRWGKVGRGFDFGGLRSPEEEEFRKRFGEPWDWEKRWPSGPDGRVKTFEDLWKEVDRVIPEDRRSVSGAGPGRGGSKGGPGMTEPGEADRVRGGGGPGGDHEVSEPGGGPSDSWPKDKREVSDGSGGSTGPSVDSGEVKPGEVEGPERVQGPDEKPVTPEPPTETRDETSLTSPVIPPPILGSSIAAPPSPPEEKEKAPVPESVTGWSDLPDETRNKLYDSVKNQQDQNYVPEAVDWALAEGRSLQELRNDSRLLQEYVNKEKSLEQERKAWYEKERNRDDALEHQRKLPGMINEFEKDADVIYDFERGEDRQQWFEQQYSMRKASEREQSRKLAAESRTDEDWRKELGKMFQRKDPRAWKVGWDKLYKEWVKAGRPKEGDKEYEKWVEAGDHPDRKWVKEQEEEAINVRKRVRWK